MDGASSTSDETEQLISFSRKKMRLMSRTDSSDSETDKEVKEGRFWLIDIRNLTSAMSKLHECDEGKQAGFCKEKPVFKSIKVLPK